MKMLNPLVVAALALLGPGLPAAAHSGHARGGPPPRGLVGFGIPMYEPSCAFACQRILQTSKLNCSTPPVADRWHGGSGLGFDTSDDCYASDTAFLLSLAWCLHQRCDEHSWTISRFWTAELAHKPTYAFEEALDLCDVDSLEVLTPGDALNHPRAVAEADWKKTATSMEDFAHTEAQGSKYALLLLLTIVFTPLLLTAAAWFLFGLSARLERWCLVHIIYPPLFRHRWPILERFMGGEGGITRGQALLVLCFALQNLLFCILGHRVRWPNIYYDTPSSAFIEIVANRTGHLAFANLAGLILYGTRNNPLIRLTGWPYTTYLLPHKWIAYACVSHALVHTVIYFVLHLHVLPHKFTQPYWNVGFTAIVIFTVILLSSLAGVRRAYYEVFLDVHILMAFFSLLACYYHIKWKFAHHWGYENWIYLSAIIWLTERLVRGLKIARIGCRTALCTQIDEDYLELSVEGVSMTGMVYLHFPNKARWRIWESHPFSIASSVADSDNSNRVAERPVDQGEPAFELVGSDSDSEFDSDPEVQGGSDSQDDACRPTSIPLVEQQGARYIALGSMTPVTPSVPGSALPLLSDTFDDKHSAWGRELSFIIRRHRGVTARLFANDDLALPVLVEGPYHPHINLFELAATSSHVVCIAGGVGITAILPLLRARSAASLGRTALYFGARTKALVESCGLYELRENAPNLDVHIRVGARWPVDYIVRQELGETERSMGSSRDGLVVTCGPPDTVHSVRLAVLEANRRRKYGVIRLVDEHFSW